MAEAPRPIRRSTQLAPLSRDHHNGLLLVQRIRLGLKKEAPPTAVSAYAHWFWQQQLQPHFQKEETLLLPLFPSERLLLQMKDEHEAIEGLLHINESIPDPALLEELATQLHDHIRFEERILFPFIEEKCNVSQLNALAEVLNKAPASCAAWPGPPFWK